MTGPHPLPPPRTHAPASPVPTRARTLARPPSVVGAEHGNRQSCSRRRTGAKKPGKAGGPGTVASWAGPQGALQTGRPRQVRKLTGPNRGGRAARPGPETSVRSSTYSLLSEDRTRAPKPRRSRPRSHSNRALWHRHVSRWNPKSRPVPHEHVPPTAPGNAATVPAGRDSGFRDGRPARTRAVCPPLQRDPPAETLQPARGEASAPPCRRTDPEKRATGHAGNGHESRRDTVLAHGLHRSQGPAREEAARAAPARVDTCQPSTAMSQPPGDFQAQALEPSGARSSASSSSARPGRSRTSLCGHLVDTPGNARPARPPGGCPEPPAPPRPDPSAETHLLDLTRTLQHGPLLKSTTVQRHRELRVKRHRGEPRLPPSIPGGCVSPRALQAFPRLKLEGGDPVATSLVGTGRHVSISASPDGGGDSKPTT